MLIANVLLLNLLIAIFGWVNVVLTTKFIILSIWIIFVNSTIKNVKYKNSILFINTYFILASRSAYSDASLRAKQIWGYQRYQLILEYTNRSVLVLISHMWDALSAIYNLCYGMCQGNVRKDKDESVEDSKERAKFDEFSRFSKFYCKKLIPYTNCSTFWIMKRSKRPKEFWGPLGRINLKTKNELWTNLNLKKQQI